jgi:hypothetical protein
MSKSRPLKEMTIHEKLAAMDLLWEDLAGCPESVDSPPWHKDVVDERRQRVADGKSQFSDSGTAKIDIRNKVS